MTKGEKLSNKGAFYFFLSGTLISLAIFLFLTWDTHRQVSALTNADQLSEQVVAGKHVWEKKNCNNCHTILGFGVYYAPDMTKVYDRIGPEAIKAAVLEPEAVYADSFRKMPNLDVTDQEADDLIAFLEWVSNIDNNDWPPQDRSMETAAQNRLEATGLSPGAAAFKEQCMACHSIGGAGGSNGPALDNAGDKYDADSIALYIFDPVAVNPDSRMPAQKNISEDDRRAIADFLAKQRGDQ